MLKLSLQHRGLKLYKVNINDDLELFTLRSNLDDFTFEWGLQQIIKLTV